MARTLSASLDSEIKFKVELIGLQLNDAGEFSGVLNSWIDSNTMSIFRVTHFVFDLFCQSQFGGLDNFGGCSHRASKFQFEFGISRTTQIVLKL